MFKSHPNKDGIEFKVHPLVHENIHAISDAHISLAHVKSQFESSPIDLDYSEYIDSLPHPHAWMIHSMVNTAKKTMLLDKIEKD